MEEIKNQILKEIDNGKTNIINFLIFSIILITFMFSCTIFYITFQTYNYDYEVPEITNTNTNTNTSND